MKTLLFVTLGLWAFGLVMILIAGAIEFIRIQKDED